MIFISYKSQDRPLVEPYALALGEVYGTEAVFYDQWSIQPGDGIIDRMNDGLGASTTFFYFVSEQSLASRMVDLEWQGALFKATNGNGKLIPVRLTAVALPPILMQTLFIDAYTEGFGVAVRQMVDVVNGENTFRTTYPKFENLTAAGKKTGEGLIVTISAANYMEAHTNFGFLINRQSSEVEIKSDAMFVGELPNITTTDGLNGNLITQQLVRPVTPGFPATFEIKSLSGSPVALLRVMRETAPSHFETVPLVWN